MSLGQKIIIGEDTITSMSEIDLEAPSDSSNFERLRRRTAEKMNGLLYTYKTHYKMAENYEKGGKILDFIVAGGTGALAAALIWGAVSQKILIIVALGVSIVSWAKAVVQLGTKSQSHYNSADQYHQLFEEFRDFAQLSLLNDEVDMSKKIERFEALSEKRKELNRSAPRTTRFWYNKLDSDEVFGTMETNDREADALLNTRESDS